MADSTAPEKNGKKIPQISVPVWAMKTGGVLLITYSVVVSLIQVAK